MKDEWNIFMDIAVTMHKLTFFVAMLEYLDDPACSRSPYCSSYSILCRQNFALPPEGFSLLGPTLCMCIQDVV